IRAKTNTNIESPRKAKPVLSVSLRPTSSPAFQQSASPAAVNIKNHIHSNIGSLSDLMKRINTEPGGPAAPLALALASPDPVC
ncbi:MAG TPA: hypothetical protein PKY50_20085, partial [Candidatus Competibacter sp.]|nr:hypothetical protein [Candidatus Competibacter sp.]